MYMMCLRRGTFTQIYKYYTKNQRSKQYCISSSDCVALKTRFVAMGMGPLPVTRTRMWLECGTTSPITKQKGKSIICPRIDFAEQYNYSG